MTAKTQALDPTRVGLTAQIIAGALMAGILAFAGVAFVISKSPVAANPMISYLAAGFAAVSVVMHFVIPSLLVGAQKAALRQCPIDQRRGLLAGAYLSKTIVGMALLEGAGFFNLVAYIVERQAWSYGVIAVLLTLMAVRFPSQGRFDEWADDLNRDLNY